MKFYYSTDGENFNTESIHDCLCDFEEGEISTIYQGEAVKKLASEFVFFDSDILLDGAYENCGDYAEGWLTTTKEEEGDLLAMVKVAVDEWADKHKKQPKFYGIRNQKEIKIKVLAESDYLVLNAKTSNIRG